MKKKHAPLQDSVRGYIREISVVMFLQIQTDMYLKRGSKTATGWLIRGQPFTFELEKRA